jgi:Asp-tRNA(Asn)/Glu-tRNA(Gln) amidotransferase A subunit family amidase
MTLIEMSRKLIRKQISSEEVVRAHLEAIERLQPSVNAFARVRAEEALEEARNPKPGRLSGVPVTVKDSLDVAGLPTACGSKLRLDTIATRDAAAVRALKAEGAILLGKTNTPEFLANYETDNGITGRTNNPWNLERTAGGSSGGEAAAIASFQSPGGLGSDGGGSIRWPAHACGIVGLKPTPGRISAAGHWPPSINPMGVMGTVGPMGRTVRDVELLFEVLASGFDAEDPFAAPVPPRAVNLDDLRVGVAEQFYKTPVQAECAEAVREAARLIEGELRIPVEEWMPEGLERTPNGWSFLFSDLPARFTREMIGERLDEVHWTGREFLDPALGRPEATARQVVETLQFRDTVRASLVRQMEQYPILLWPAAGHEAFAHGQRRYTTTGKEIGLFEMILPLTPWNFLGFPALVLPMRLTASGMPVGVQLIGRPWDEERLLLLGARIEEARGPFRASTR